MRSESVGSRNRLLIRNKRGAELILDLKFKIGARRLRALLPSISADVALRLQNVNMDTMRSLARARFHFGGPSIWLDLAGKRVVCRSRMQMQTRAPQKGKRLLPARARVSGSLWAFAVLRHVRNAALPSGELRNCVDVSTHISAKHSLWRPLLAAHPSQEDGRMRAPARHVITPKLILIRQRALSAPRANESIA